MAIWERTVKVLCTKRAIKFCWERRMCNSFFFPFSQPSFLRTYILSSFLASTLAGSLIDLLAKEMKQQTQSVDSYVLSKASCWESIPGMHGCLPRTNEPIN